LRHWTKPLQNQTITIDGCVWRVWRAIFSGARSPISYSLFMVLLTAKHHCGKASNENSYCQGPSACTEELSCFPKNKGPSLISTNEAPYLFHPLVLSSPILVFTAKWTPERPPGPVRSASHCAKNTVKSYLCQSTSHARNR